MIQKCAGSCGREVLGNPSMCMNCVRGLSTERNAIKQAFQRLNVTLTKSMKWDEKLPDGGGWVFNQERAETVMRVLHGARNVIIREREGRERLGVDEGDE